MDHLPSLATERLLLRVPAPSDAESLALFHARNREHLAPWEPQRPEGHCTADFWRGELVDLERQVLDERLVSFVLLPRVPPGADIPILGRISITNIIRGCFQAAHLGFSLAHDAQGQGFMFEALTAVVRFAFEDLRLHRLMANYQPHNARSAGVLRRLGFQEEGFAREYLRLDGAWRDHVLTSRINETYTDPP